MKKLSFKALEAKMRNKGLLLTEENLRSITGGKMPGEMQPLSLVAADPFTHTDTTIVQEGALSRNNVHAHSAGSVAQSFVQQDMQGDWSSSTTHNDPTTTMPVNPAQQLLNNNFNIPAGTSLTQTLPSQFHIGSNGLIYNSDNELLGTGLTYTSGGQTYIYIASGTFSQNDIDYETGVILHKVIHSWNLNNYGTSYNNEKSEYAAYTAEMNYYNSIGRADLYADAAAQRSAYSNGGYSTDGHWKSN